MQASGFVLVGGASTRMGQDKALLPYRGTTLSAHVAAAVQETAGSAILLGDPARYGALGFPVQADLVSGAGPLGGLYTALTVTQTDWNVVVACDMPGVSASILDLLVERASTTSADAVVAAGPDGEPQPLCAVYHRRCLPAVSTALQAKSFGMRDLLRELKIEAVLVELASIANVNTPFEWSQVENEPPAEKLHYIEFQHVFKTFDHPVLVDVSFHVDAGETLAIIGRSGVGKSVSLGHIMGFLKPDQGRVVVAYQDTTDFLEAQLREIRKKVTMVFQSGALFDSLTVGENILFSLELRSDYDEHNKEDVVDGLLSMVGLLHLKNDYPSELSTGHKRAVAIARALAAQPECILYDEPTTMVDPIMSDTLIHLMLKLKNDLGLTAVVVTHDLDLMRKVADSVVILHEGKAIYFGPVRDLDKAEHPHIREFLANDRVELV
jgi:ABC-type transporter Mla maintaining outer membrane lipid asymmetry ATPase subunit MlaF/molybdopterin-guanine dinucleotide biosynthesis protein A